MRLCQVEEKGISLAEFHGENIPPYAILSHTWGPDHDEVTYSDVLSGKGENKAGYQKLHFCRKQAIQDGLRYFWVDSCNIDRASSSELSEAINSMWSWYHKARKCYVYLSDVSTQAAHQDIELWMRDFQKSRWFTRGWTLQELLAPNTVEFYSKEGELLGDKLILERIIHQVTGIDIKALRGESLHTFSIGQRLSWTSRRQTKREEDAVYSLLGIFGVHMPMIYGEGRRGAFIRLEKEIENGASLSVSAIENVYVSLRQTPQQEASIPIDGSLPRTSMQKKTESAENKSENDMASALLNAMRMAREEAEQKAALRLEEIRAKYEMTLVETQVALEEAQRERKAAEEELRKLKASATPEPKPVLRFKDAVGRKFHFPWEIAKTWKGMEELIKQAFLHVDVLGPHVNEGHYDLVGPDVEIILPQVWESMIRPNWSITMHMWPMPEPPSPLPYFDLPGPVPPFPTPMEAWPRPRNKKEHPKQGTSSRSRRIAKVADVQIDSGLPIRSK